MSHISGKVIRHPAKAGRAVFFAPFLIPCIAVALMLIPAKSAAAQHNAAGSKEPEFIITPILEALYSRRTPAIGGGLALGGGGRVAVGARALYAVDFESIHSLEIAVFMRMYPINTQASFFVQAHAGAVVFSRNSAISVPEETGLFSAAVGAGWRMDLNSSIYLEASVRTGTPYLIGGGLCAGIRL